MAYSSSFFSRTLAYTLSNVRAGGRSPGREIHHGHSGVGQGMPGPAQSP
jgi:hypothetical protein